MPLPPDHYREIEAQAKSYRDGFRAPRHRIVIWVGAALSIALVALVVFSLTTKQKQSGHGCIDFNYTTPVGGAEMYKCGPAARDLCVSPSSQDSLTGGFDNALHAACRKAGLPTTAG